MKLTMMDIFTEEQQRASDMHNESLHRIFFENYMTAQQDWDMHASARTAIAAITVPQYDVHVAMPAIAGNRDDEIYQAQHTL